MLNLGIPPALSILLAFRKHHHLLDAIPHHNVVNQELHITQNLRGSLNLSNEILRNTLVGLSPQRFSIQRV